MKSELISVVIPLYNAADYIEDCLKSVQNQSYSFFECVIVNDGSTDNSLEKATAFSNSDSRFRVINQEHAGVSYAISKGIEHACGEWLYFLDSDDWIDTTELQHLYKMIIENCCDMVASNYVIESDKSEIQSIVRFNGVISQKEYPDLFYPQFLCNERYSGIVCGNTRGGKLVRRSLAINNKHFQEGMYFAEDAILMLGILCDCRSVCADISHAGYHYRKHSASSMHNYGFSYVVYRADYAQKIRTLYEMKGIAGDIRLEENYWRFNLYNVLGSLQAIGFAVNKIEDRYPQTYEWMQHTIERLALLDKRVLGKRNVLLLWMLRHRMFLALSIMYQINHFLKYTLNIDDLTGVILQRRKK